MIYATNSLLEGGEGLIPVTAKLEVKFLKPLKVGYEVIGTGEVTSYRKGSRNIRAKASLKTAQNGIIIAEAEAIIRLVPEV